MDGPGTQGGANVPVPPGVPGGDGQASDVLALPPVYPDPLPAANDSEQESDSGDEEDPSEGADDDGPHGRHRPDDSWTVPTRVRAQAGRQLYNGSGQNPQVDPVELHAARLAAVVNTPTLDSPAKARDLLYLVERKARKVSSRSKPSRVIFDVRPVLGPDACLQAKTIIINGNIALYNNSLSLVEFIPIFAVPDPTDPFTFEAQEHITPQVHSHPGWPVGGLKFSDEFLGAIDNGSGKFDKDYLYTWPVIQTQIRLDGKAEWEISLCIHNFLSRRMNGEGLVGDWDNFLNFSKFPGSMYAVNNANERLTAFYQNQRDGIPMPHLPDMDPTVWGVWEQWQALWGPSCGAKEDDMETWSIPIFAWLLMVLPTAMVLDPADHMGSVPQVSRRAEGHPVLQPPVTVNFPFLAAATCYPEIAELCFRIVKADKVTELIMLSDPRVGPVLERVDASWAHLHRQCHMMVADTSVFHLLNVVPDVIRRGAESAREWGPPEVVYRGVEQWRFDKLVKEHEACGRSLVRDDLARLYGPGNGQNQAPMPGHDNNNPPFPAGPFRHPRAAPALAPAVSPRARPPVQNPTRGSCCWPLKPGQQGVHYTQQEKCCMLALFDGDRILLEALEAKRKEVTTEKDPDKMFLPAMAQEVRAAWIESQRSRLQLVHDRAQPLVRRHTDSMFKERVRKLVSDIQNRLGNEDGREAIEPGPAKEPSAKDFKNMLPNSTALATEKQQEQFLSSVRQHLRKAFTLSSLITFAQCVSEAFGSAENETMAERSRRMYEDIGEVGMDVTRARALFVDCCKALERMIHPPMTMVAAQKVAHKVSVTWDPRGLADVIREFKRLGKRVRAFEEPRYECVEFDEGPAYLMIDPAVEFFQYHVVRSAEYASIVTAASRSNAWTLGELYFEVAKRCYHLRGTRSTVSFGYRLHRAPYDAPPAMPPPILQQDVSQPSGPQGVPPENRCTFEFLCKGGPMSHYLLRSPPEPHDRLDCHNLREATLNAGFWDPKHPWDRPAKSFIDRFMTFSSCAASNRKPYPWTGSPSAPQAPMSGRYGPQSGKGNGGKGGGGKGGKGDKGGEKGGHTQAPKPQQEKEENSSPHGTAKTAQVTSAPLFPCTDIRLGEEGVEEEMWSGSESGIQGEGLGGGDGLNVEASSFIPSTLARVDSELPPLPCAMAWGEDYLTPLTRLASRAMGQVFSDHHQQDSSDTEMGSRQDSWDPALDPLLEGVPESGWDEDVDEEEVLGTKGNSGESAPEAAGVDSPASPEEPQLRLGEGIEPLSAPLGEVPGEGDSQLERDREEVEARVEARMTERATAERERVADEAADETVLAAGTIAPLAVLPAPPTDGTLMAGDEPMDTSTPAGTTPPTLTAPAPAELTLPTPPPHKAFLGVPPARSTPETPDPANIAGPSGQMEMERQARALAQYIQQSWGVSLSELGGSSFLQTRTPKESLAKAVREGPASPTADLLPPQQEQGNKGKKGESSGAVRHRQGLPPPRQTPVAGYSTSRCYRCKRMGHVSRFCPDPDKSVKNPSPMKRPAGHRRSPDRESRGRDARRREDHPEVRGGGSRPRDPPPSPASRRPSGSSSADRSKTMARTANQVAAIAWEVGTLGRMLGDSAAPTRAIERGTGWTLSIPNVGASEDSPAVGGLFHCQVPQLSSVKYGMWIPEFTIRGVSVWSGGERVMLYDRARTHSREVSDGGGAAAKFVADAHTALVPGKPLAKHPCPSVIVVINGIPVRAILDTGATSSLVGDFLRESTEGVWPWRELENPVRVLIADGTLSSVSEAANVSMSWNGMTRQSLILYMKGLKDMMLFGMESASLFGPFTVCPSPEEPGRYTAVPSPGAGDLSASRRCLLPLSVEAWIDEENDARRRCGQAFSAVYSLPADDFSPPDQDVSYVFALEWRDGRYGPPGDFHRLKALAGRRESVAFRSQECHGLEYPGKASREILEPGMIPRGAIQIYVSRYAEIPPLTAAPVLCRVPPTGEWLVQPRPDPFLFFECSEAVVSGDSGNEQWIFFRNESHHLVQKFHVGSYVAIATPVSTVEVRDASPELLRRVQVDPVGARLGRMEVDDEEAEWGMIQPEAPQPDWPTPEEIIGDLDLSYLAKAGLSEERIRSILLLHKGVVMRHKGDLGLLRYGHHEIELNNETPFLDPPRRLNPGRMEALREIIDRGLENGTFAPSKSAWASPIVLVKKKDGTLRLCIDYRTLNRRTTPDAYPLPRIDAILDACSGAKFFMCLDLGTAFWQVRMSKRAAEVAAFVTPFGLYEPVRMPMGPRNGPATFQRIMDTITLGLKGVQSYIDDLLVVGRTEEELYERFQALLACLEDAGAKLRADKCCFGAVELEFLGFSLSRVGITPPAKHVEAIRAIELPTTLKEVQRFVGCCNFFRGLIPSFATIARPLTDAMRGCKKGQKLVVSDDFRRAFQQLKDILGAYPLICYPDHDKPFTLITDASGVAVGSALLQRSDEGVLRPIGYMSRRLSPVQERWDTTERELYAMVSGFEYFQVYLLGRTDTVVITDHRPLKALDSLRSSKPKIWRWILYLEDFRPFHVEFRPGKENMVADLLSRAFLARVKGPVIDKNNQDPPPPIPKLFETAVKTAQANDPVCQEISALLQKSKGLNNAEKERRKKYKYVGELLCVVPKKKEGPTSRLRVYIPESLVRHTVAEAHNDDVHGHVGAERLFRRLNQLLVAPDLRRHINEVTKACGTCAKYRPSSWKYEDSMRGCVDKDAPRLFGGWSLDLVSFAHNKNTQYLCVCVEWLTRYAEVVPLKNKAAESVAAALLTSIIPRYGCPDVLLTDQGTEFCNKIVDSIFLHTGTTHLTTTPYTAAANGIVERKNREIKEALTRIVRDDPGQWPTWVPLVTLLLNTREPSKGETGQSPFELLFQATPQIPNPTELDELVSITAQLQRGGRSNRDTVDKIRKWAHQEILERNQTQNAKHNDAVPVVEWSVGDVVFSKVEAQDKMAPRASGPFLVWAVSQSRAQLSLLDANAPARPPVWISASRCTKVGYVEFQPTMSRENWAAAAIASHGATQVTVFPPAPGPPPPVQARAPSRKSRAGKLSRCVVAVRKEAYEEAGRGAPAVGPPAAPSVAAPLPLAAPPMVAPPPPVAQVLPQPVPGAQPPNNDEDQGIADVDD